MMRLLNQTLMWGGGGGWGEVREFGRSTASDCDSKLTEKDIYRQTLLALKRTGTDLVASRSQPVENIWQVKPLIRRVDGGRLDRVCGIEGTEQVVGTVTVIGSSLDRNWIEPRSEPGVEETERVVGTVIGSEPGVEGTEPVVRTVTVIGPNLDRNWIESRSEPTLEGEELDGTDRLQHEPIYFEKC